jgi:DNA-binding transcriptional regulator YiaG
MDRNHPGTVAPTPAEIRSARKAARLSQAAFARLLQVNPCTPGRWERGESTPRGLQLLALWEALAMLAKGRRANERINKAVNL